MRKHIFAYMRYFLVLCVVIVLHIFNNHPVTLFLIFATITFPVLSVVFHYRFAKGIDVSLRFDDTYCERNQTVALVISLRNRTWYPHMKLLVSFGLYDIGLPNDYQHEYRFVLGARKQLEYRVPMHFSHCGVFRAEIKNVVSSEVIELMSVKIPCSQRCEMIVLPSKVEISLFTEDIHGRFVSDDDMELPQKGNDPSEIYDYRNYQIGDSLHSIHWKLTAKELTLIVKEYGDVTGEALWILLDYFCSDPRQKDAFFDFLYSVSRDLWRRKIPFSLMWMTAKNDMLQSRRICEEDDIIQVILALLYTPIAKECIGASVLQDVAMPSKIILSTKSYRRNSKYRTLCMYNNLVGLYQYIEE